MIIYAIDDERNALELLKMSIEEAIPNAEIYCFEKTSDLIENLKNVVPDILFSDIQMPGYTGLELAMFVKKYNPKLNVVFVTSYDEYVREALSVHASGYITKPVTKSKVLEEIKNLLYPLDVQRKGIYIKTFGNFDLIKDGVAIKFKREKSKELLALLIDRDGASLKNEKIAAYLYPDKPYDRKVKNQITTIIFDLKNTLKEIDAEDIIVKGWGIIQLDKSKFECDLYDYLMGNLKAINSFCGEYMEEYSWAEETKARLYWQNKI